MGSKRNYQTIDFKQTKYLSDDERANIEGPLATLFFMFDGWQPAPWAIKQIYSLGINKTKILRYLISFRKFYIENTNCFFYKTEWNKRFIAHCERKRDWDTRSLSL